MLKFVNLLFTACLLYFLTSCDYIHNLMEQGDITEQTIDIGQIRHIIADAPCRIILHNSESNIAFIKGYNNLIEDLELLTENGTLSITHKRKNYLQKSKLIEIGLSANYLNRLTANCALELEAPEVIKTEQFTMIMNGGAKFAEIELNLDCLHVVLNVFGRNNIGNYHLGGKSHSTSLTMEGSVNIDALNLESHSVNVVHKSIGNCKVCPVASLNVKTYSSGNTYYRGNPDIIHERIKVNYLQNTGNIIQIH
ncbi:GIN domain-containing protein [Carboxylicivirga taeanensis]|uniref:GIN domain-containing protein n=1 Tax=Carboxylicivirga taeanensis TaxID=1416875 RepID=UPI003F6DDC2C